MAELIKEGKIRAWGVSNETTFGEDTLEGDASVIIAD